MKTKTSKSEEKAKEPTATYTGRLDPNRLQATFAHVEAWLLEQRLLDDPDDNDADAETEQ